MPYFLTDEDSYLSVALWPHSEEGSVGLTIVANLIRKMVVEKSQFILVQLA